MKNFLEKINTHEQKYINLLRNDFRTVFEEYNIDVVTIDSLFKKITEAYQSKERNYHNLKHIEHLLSFLKERQAEIKNWQDVQLAVWFHDVIYNTKATDNEIQSAQLAKNELTLLGIPNDSITHVEKLIHTTITHQPIDGDSDSEFFLDADLSILGLSEKEYDKYAENIRKEYSWVSKDKYTAGRKNVLENFLARPRIYFTKDAHSKLDTQARINIQREISQLK
jgi:predicted metal-dependent HD superfamily phosphohydrolase